MLIKNRRENLSYTLSKRSATSMLPTLVEVEWRYNSFSFRRWRYNHGGKIGRRRCEAATQEALHLHYPSTQGGYSNAITQLIVIGRSYLPTFFEMPRSCTAFGCNEKQNKGSGISLHRLVPRKNNSFQCFDRNSNINDVQRHSPRRWRSQFFYYTMLFQFFHFACP